MYIYIYIQYIRLDHDTDVRIVVQSKWKFDVNSDVIAHPHVRDTHSVLLHRCYKE